MPVPNTFANATATIPLSQLDANFATTITLGNTAIQLGNTVSTLNNMTLANVTVTSGNVTITNVTVTTANVTTANIATAQIANVTVSGTGTFAAGSNTAPSITTSGDTNTGIYFPAADTIAFTEGGVESMRIDSAGNVGIGTSSPSYKLDVAGSVRLQTSSGYNFFFQTSGTTARINYLNDAFSTNISAAYRATDFTWQKSDGSDVLKLDSSGNLGLGVTPSAWGGAGYSGRALEIGAVGNSLWGVNATNLYLMNNAYYDGAFKYASANAASRYLQQGGSHIWGTAASGTAGNAITFTQAMTLDANGNLVVGGSTALNTSAGRGNITVNGSSTAIVSFGVGNASKGYLYHDGTNMSLVSDVSGYLNFATNGTERARITSGGDLLVGKTSGAGYRFELSGNGMYLTGSAGYNAYFGQANIFMTTGSGTDTAIRSDTNLLFGAGGSTERMRIDASGFTQFSGNLVMPYQGAPTSKAAAATLTGAELITGILNTTGTTYTITLPTGANIEGALTWAGNNVSLDWYVINTASGTITIGANGNTTLGSLTIATGTSAHFRIRRTATNTFTVYRL